MFHECYINFKFIKLCNDLVKYQKLLIGHSINGTHIILIFDVKRSGKIGDCYFVVIIVVSNQASFVIQCLLKFRIWNIWKSNVFFHFSYVLFLDHSKNGELELCISMCTAKMAKTKMEKFSSSFDKWFSLLLNISIVSTFRSKKTIMYSFWRKQQ